MAWLTVASTCGATFPRPPSTGATKTQQRPDPATKPVGSRAHFTASNVDEAPMLAIIRLNSTSCNQTRSKLGDKALQSLITETKNLYSYLILVKAEEREKLNTGAFMSILGPTTMQIQNCYLKSLARVFSVVHSPLDNRFNRIRLHRVAK